VEIKAKVRAIYKILLKTYSEPERSRMDAVSELVCTILSQNTNDNNRDRAYTALRTRFPTWEQVRDAPIKHVIAAIRPAGLANQKGPRIQRVLRYITDECRRRSGQPDGDPELNIDFLADLPVEEAKQWLMSLDGVGPKTASIVLLFSLNRPAFPVDTHVHRVTTRLGLIPEGTSAEKAHGLLESLVPPEWYYSFHLNLIAHGRVICKAQRPRCEICPLQKHCDYFRDVWSITHRTTGDKR
jgi:endonuclease-3